MSRLIYILKSIFYYKKQHLAVLFGVIITTAVLTGALIIGDSVRYSLSQIVESRLGKIQFALLTNDRFVRAKLAKEISEKLEINSAAALLLEGTSSNPENEKRINKTQVIGIDSDFWQISDIKMPELSNEEAIVSSNIAEKLSLKINDEIVLRIEKLSVIPLNSPFSTEEVPSISFRLKIKAIADDNKLGRFSLKSNQIAPFNIFVSRELLSSKLDITGMTNALLFASDENTKINNKILDSILPKTWQLKDAGIELNKLDNKGNYELSSDRIFFDKQISTSIIENKKTAKTILSYLVNSIRLNEKTTPYSFVTAVSDNYIGKQIKENEIIINDWLSEDLNARAGDTLSLSYFVIDSLRKLKKDSSRFIVKSVMPTKDSLINRTLMPKFPGFASAISCVEWNTNLPINLKNIREKDEKYWNNFRGTPKAVISIAAGKKLWQNNFGDFTSIRFNGSAFDSRSNKNNLENEILKNIKPNELNFSFVDVKASGKNAAKSGVDFGELFLSLSFFVILAGIILTVMLHVLSLESRKSEVGTLISMGFSRKNIIKLKISESVIIILSGCIFGVLAGIIYNYLLLAAINSVWNDIVRTPMMHISIKPITLLIGFISGFIISLISIYIVSIRNLKNTAIGLINDSKQAIQNKKSKSNRASIILILLCFSASLGLVAFLFFKSLETNASLFLFSGGIFMIACLIMSNRFIGSLYKANPNYYSLAKLAFKNTSRNKNRSLTIIILLALGVFVVIITGANRKTFYGLENDNSSGTGGYSFWAETSIPITSDLNSALGKEKLGISNDSLMANADFIQFLTLKGDDASCLNLNQVKKPSIIGVNPNIFNNRKSFSFETLKNGVDKLNPWLELNKIYGENIIPAYADQTVITWGIMKKVGDTLAYLNENGKKIYLVLAGGLDASIFQGNILISDNNFSKNFPSNNGSKLMLIDIPTENQKYFSEQFNTSLKDYGIEISNTSERLSQFNSITNTYLSVFMILGGLGLIIGTIGIGIILYRNMIDRKQEIAMLKALGFSKQKIFKLIFLENLFLVFIGISIGLVSSLIGILPTVISKSFQMYNSNFILLLVLIIFVNTLFWIYLPIIKTLKNNIISSLRSE
ncbi:MAG: ABC transporter permease [Bacteroidota bacterium]